MLRQVVVLHAGRISGGACEIGRAKALFGILVCYSID